MPSNGKPPANPVAGTVTFTDKSGHTVTVTVGASGRFTVRLAAGNYTALLAPTRLAPARENIRVQANRTLTINVLCSWDSGDCG
ncbi:carboxypeptidase regulatory-like domain-containing protein [Trebonia kvetii]|uniref:Carboxypeptidase regulatory-like domain-containing protein n=1 Tax=Trebonia kvetii TaxID=2480626 RepID=A0A6P2C5F2_9ACTN|nr:carboxypeptidase-like regulatory domain-containing protein [Trebonia kvetii]TVZ06400.1 carboxypeptidase regulatory-like domain-containing protein [Trebonia kvetii]